MIMANAYRDTFTHVLRNILSYNHTITDGIGFDSASLEVAVSPGRADSALGLIGKFISIYSHTYPIWRGFINQIGINRGPYYTTIGPLSNIANKIIVGYTDYDTGEKAFTSPISNDDSIIRYGTFCKVINGGKIPATLASENASTALEEMQYPEVTDTFRQNESSTIKIDALGLGHLLKEYPYNNAADSTAYSHVIIQDVLSAQPDSLFSTDYSNFVSTTLSLNTLQEDYKSADSIIKEAVEIGSDNNYPLSFGIYGQTAVLASPFENISEMGYIHVPGENFVRTMTNHVILPQFIRPGRTLIYSGVLKRFGGRGNLLGDGATIIQGVSFTAPDQFTINGSTLQTLSQKLAKQRGF